MKTAIVIPARLKSTRLPGKLLLDLEGRSVLQRTWEKASKVNGIQGVLVAADSQEILDEVEKWGGTGYITDPDLPSGTLRIHAILNQTNADFIINLQGDEPFADPTLIAAMIERAKETNCDVVTAVHQIEDIDDLFNKNLVKVLRANSGQAIYFSRSACPTVRDKERLDWLEHHTYWGHIGIYGYTRKALKWYAKQQPSALEKVESLEQLRFIDHGWHFQTVEAKSTPIGIDTAEDLELARQRIRNHGNEADHRNPEAINEHYVAARNVFYREIDALETILTRNKATIPKVVTQILSASGKVIVTGLGKSGIIAHKIAATLSSTGTTAVYLNAAEALHGDLGVVDSGDVIIMLSNSAKTAELLAMMPSFQNLGVKTVGIFGSITTPLAKQVDFALRADVEREACPINLAPMSSTTSALVLGDAIAGALMSAKKTTSEHFALFHPGGTLGRRLLSRVSDVICQEYQTPRVKSNEKVKEVIGLICSSHYGAACVVDDTNELVGIITDGDIRRYINRSSNLEASAASIMNDSPITVNNETHLSECLKIMEENKIYAMPVLDSQDSTLIGMVRMLDII